MGLMLVTTPSALARKIVDLICTHKRKPMDACCCKETVSGIWTAKLPENVRTAIANKSLGGREFATCLEDCRCSVQSILTTKHSGINNCETSRDY